MQRSVMCLLGWMAWSGGSGQAAAPVDLPWREAGLSERQAAAHLLDRLAYGARPGDIDRVVETGLERWLETQLAGELPDRELAARLAGLRSLTLSNREILETYPNPGRLLVEARRGGVLDEDASPDAADGEMRRAVRAYARDRGYRPQRELLGELMTQKLLRAVASPSQLTEVLTDFWFNHFNVSLTDGETRAFVGTYERDAIRPFVLGRFRDMLEATAKHPAMLLYLDNARSVAEEGTTTTLDRRRRELGGARRWRRGAMASPGGDPGLDRRRLANRPRGLNENYARELMELHTLGVDGGYTQEDVIEVARAFTGWTVVPPRALDPRVESRLARVRRFPRAGFVVDGDFLFRADAHDAGEKRILGRTLPAGRGIQDGLEVLDLLAAHPPTARHLATKLAARFVSDDPPEPLVARLGARYLESGGDLKAMVLALVESPEFWAPAAVRQKIKSPFEVAASALRALDAEVRDPRQVLEWIFAMGQRLYAYEAPTGFPDRAEAWVNTGSLLSRMHFGLELASGRVTGVDFDLVELNAGREPGSLDEALHAYVRLLLPERDTAETLGRLGPLVRDPELWSKVSHAAADGRSLTLGRIDGPTLGGRRARREARPRGGPVDAGPQPVAHVVGVILGSPEFQRR